MISLLFSLVSCNCQVPPLRWHNLALERTYWAIRQVESSGGKDVRDGDSGEAVGELQLHKRYVDDANRILKCKTFSYEDRRNPVLSRTMFRICSLHYHPQGTPEQWSKTFHRGTSQERKAYWAKVKSAMEALP
jgi:hypothetical protein